MLRRLPVPIVQKAPNFSHSSRLGGAICPTADKFGFHDPTLLSTAQEQFWFRAAYDLDALTE